MAPKKKPETKTEEAPKKDALSNKSFLNMMNKKLGEETLYAFEGERTAKIQPVSTGVPSLDFALGIGGLPWGRLVEIYGPESSGKTTIALKVVAEFQKNAKIIPHVFYGKKVVFIDAEHALDPIHAQALGVDISEDGMLIMQPDYGEQAYDAMVSLILSGHVGLIVGDSLPSFIPKAVVDGSAEDNHMMIAARLNSQMIPVVTQHAQKNNTLVIMINQIREKPTMYGCLHADTKINFVDGRSLPIRKVVEEQISGQVWSYNEESSSMEAREITDWHHNGFVETHEDYIHFEAEGIETKNGIFGFTVTPDHKVLTQLGWKEAKNISFQDKLVSKYKSIINSSLQEFLYGMFIGDSTLRVRKNNSACISLQDNQNPEYLSWKLEKLSPFISFKKNGKRFDSEFSYELKLMKDQFQNRNPLSMLINQYSDLSLALWYMDDGHLDIQDYHNRCSISAKRFKNNHEILSKIVATLNNQGFECDYKDYDGSIRFTANGSKDLMNRIVKYIPDSMQYKLTDDLKGQYEDFNLHSEIEYKVTHTKILNIRFASDRQIRQKGKYDISIEGNHNYLVGGLSNGIIVHNSPETTPGGRAMKFYSSVRMEVKRKEIKKGDVVLGQTIFVTVKKNKVSRPFTKSEFDYYWDTGIDVIKDIMNVAMDMDIIKRAGSYYYYGEDHKNPLKDGAGNELKWMGKETVENVLKQSPALFAYTNDIVQGRIPKDAVFVDEDHSQDGELEQEEALTEPSDAPPVYEEGTLL